MLLTAALLVFVALYALRMVRRPDVSPWPAIVAALALPLPIELTGHWLPLFVRLGATVWGVVVAFKAWDLAHRRVSDPRMLQRPSTTLLWLFIPPDTRLPDDPATARRTRAAGWARLGRAALKLPPALLLWGLETQYPQLHQHIWLEGFWALWLTWLATTGATDLVSALPMLRGVAVAEIFRTPMFARSPRDFWNNRWNLYVRRWIRRNLFVAIGGRRSVARAVVITFVLSGVMHEYLVAAASGTVPDRVGWMTAFFAVHGLAVLGEMTLMRRFGRRPWLSRPAATLAHLVWLSATAPLFFGPLGEIFTALR